jgi:putative sigma-54 modulation protein
VKISARHGHLGEDAHRMIQDKAEKLLHFFERLTMIEVVIDLKRTSDERCHVELKAQAEHKHDFVATETATEVMAAVDHAVAKIEGQLRRYKEKIQDHRRTPHAGERAQPGPGAEA